MIHRLTLLTLSTLVGLTACLTATGAPPAEGTKSRPNVLIITIDTLRADRLSGYGYGRSTSPNLDLLMEGGVRFSQARTVEPLTAPSMCSMITSRHPHVHGTSRNGLRMETGLSSLPTVLAEDGYRTAAFVSNWTLRHKLSGLGEHFQIYEEVLRHKRWFGLFSGEATASHVNATALEWLEEHLGDEPHTPYLLWLHYSEPHAPYVLQENYVARLGLRPPVGPKGKPKRKIRPSDRYDSEIAAVDAAVGQLLAGIRRLDEKRELLVLFASDHGESLGEHNYWGHGRNLYEPTLHIPMSLTWTGRLQPTTIEAPSLIIDLAATAVSLLGLDVPDEFEGFDWMPVLTGATEPPMDRTTFHQAHKGAVLSRHDSELARQAGLLEVGLVRNGVKETFRIKGKRHRKFDLTEDPTEVTDLASNQSDPTDGLQQWMIWVSRGLSSFDDRPPEPLDEESVEALRALGYAD